MASASTSRFTLLPSNYFATQQPSSEITLPSLLEASERLADEAKEALPYKHDFCTHSLGYLRQSVWSCIDCGEKGVCYGCSISCHSEHKLVELWTKRHFRCDCPTFDNAPESSSAAQKRHCTLNPAHCQPEEVNKENTYGKNFSGVFCRCGRDYDPETEEEAMVTCIACEDWFHESCLNLNSKVKPKAEPAVGVQASLVDDDEDEDEDVLIPSSSYDGLICAECVQSHELLRSRAGSQGWMIVEPNDEGIYKVVGGLSGVVIDAARGIKAEEKVTGQSSETLPDSQVDNTISNSSTKHKLDEKDLPDGKKPRLDVESSKDDANGSVSEENQKKWKGKGDVFLADGVREALKGELSAETAASLPFPLEDAEIYEPPRDDDQEETFDDVTSRVVGALPRVQAIEALHGYQNMKNRLQAMLASHAQNGKAVTKEEIEEVFATLRAARRQW